MIDGLLLGSVVHGAGMFWYDFHITFVDVIMKSLLQLFERFKTHQD